MGRIEKPVHGKGRGRPATWLVVAGCLVSPLTASAETISQALAQAYTTNPDVNQQRAATRATDEGVAIAKSGFRPQVSGNASLGFTDAAGPLAAPLGRSSPASFGANVSQTLFDGNQTTNRVRQAVSQVFASRENLRGTEQTTLLAAATAYMNVLRDTALLELNKNNIIVLLEQLRETRLRYGIKEVTITDVAQAETGLASARSQYLSALATLRNDIAYYKQVIGRAPERLEPARPIYALVPHTVEEASAQAFQENPTIQAALHSVDSAELQVQVNEGALYPTLSVSGGATHSIGTVIAPTQYSRTTTVTANLSVPIYSGGQASAVVRQSKESLAQARLVVELQRRAIEAAVISSYNQYVTARGLVISSRAAVKSAEIALLGIRFEASVGQRTTYDILVAQQTLLNARTSLVSAEHDEVVGTYAVAASIGTLSASRLGLEVIQYDPTIHYQQVKDKWYGLRTADGR